MVFPKFRLVGIALLWLASSFHMRADEKPTKDGAPTPITTTTKFSTLHIPRLSRRPMIADFLEMRPSPDLAAQMLKVDGFLQRDPKDGAPISQKTEAYLGYTEKNLYV